MGSTWCITKVGYMGKRSQQSALKPKQLLSTDLWAISLSKLVLTMFIIGQDMQAKLVNFTFSKNDMQPCTNERLASLQYNYREYNFFTIRSHISQLHTLQPSLVIHISQTKG